MTIIVYRNGIMSSDSRAEVDSVGIAEVTKIFHTPTGGLVGFAGLMGAALRLITWVSKYDGVESKFPGGARNSCSGIWVKSDGSILLFDSNDKFMSAKTEWAVVGNCHAFAYGCLASDKTAIETVDLCIKHCSGVGGQIQSLVLGEKPIRKGFWNRFYG